MPDVDLSTLGGPELRRLLDAARGRGQATLSYQILQEMAVRRNGGGPRGRRPGGRRAEPRMAALNFGDPLDRWDEAADDPSAAPPAEPEPVEPLYLEREYQEREPPHSPPPPPPARPRRGRWLAAGLVLGVAVGVPLGLGMGRIGAEPATPLMQPAAEAVSAALAPPPAPPPPAPPLPAPTTPEPAALAPEPAVEPPAAPDPAEATTTPAEPEPKPAAPAAEEVATPAPPASKACAGAPTPADRAICADPDLQRLQRDLRRAYAEALDAHEDRALLRVRQLAWRDARDGVSDPDRLARLYRERIRKLNAATEDARRRR